jgi:hypothetical protein
VRRAHEKYRRNDEALRAILRLAYEREPRYAK